MSERVLSSKHFIDVGCTLILTVTAVKTCIKNSGAGDELLKYSIGNGDMLGTFELIVA